MGDAWVVTRCGGAGCYAFELLWYAGWRCIDEKHNTIIDGVLLLRLGDVWVVTKCGGAGCYAFELLWCARWRCLDEKHNTVIDELMLLTIYHSDLCVGVCVGVFVVMLF